jgi:hypothetical protein
MLKKYYGRQAGVAKMVLIIQSSCFIAPHCNLRGVDNKEIEEYQTIFECVYTNARP